MILSPTAQKRLKLGTTISAVATPIARFIGSNCIDPETNDLKPESDCAKKRDMLNEGRYADAFYDIFWKPKQKEQ